MHLASTAVKARLAATAQVHGPVPAFSWHLGDACESEEWTATFKTIGARYADLEAHIIAEHTWDRPEVTAIALDRGAPHYLRWMETATEPSSS